MASKKVIKVKLVSTGLNAKGNKTGTFYTTLKKVGAAAKLKLKKFDRMAIHPVTGKAGAHVQFEEGKIK